MEIAIWIIAISTSVIALLFLLLFIFGIDIGR